MGQQQSTRKEESVGAGEDDAFPVGCGELGIEVVKS